MPEFSAPGIGRESNDAVIDAEFGDSANGVLSAVDCLPAGRPPCLRIYMLLIENCRVQTDKLPAGKYLVEISTVIPKPAGPAEV